MLVIGPSWGFIEDVFAGILCLSSAGYRGLQWCSLLAGSRSRRYPESNHVALTGKFITYRLFLGHFHHFCRALLIYLFKLRPAACRGAMKSL